MIQDTRYASLSSGLLARKGAAKPAMRPQSYGGFDDCGWNDMGHANGNGHEPREEEHVPSSIAALTPLPRGDESPVAAQQRAIADSFDERGEEPTPPVKVALPVAVAPRAPAQVVALPRRPEPATALRKAAFTLRLDAERHLRLRLACAVTGRSAQLLVASALDRLLETIPEIEALAAITPARNAKR